MARDCDRAAAERQFRQNPCRNRRTDQPETESGQKAAQSRPAQHQKADAGFNRPRARRVRRRTSRASGVRTEIQPHRYRYLHQHADGADFAGRQCVHELGDDGAGQPPRAEKPENDFAGMAGFPRRYRNTSSEIPFEPSGKTAAHP